MKNAAYGKAMENLRSRIDVKLVSNKKDYLKWTSKPSFMSHKIFDNNLATIRENKVTLTLKKPACIKMRILELSKVLTHPTTRRCGDNWYVVTTSRGDVIMKSDQYVSMTSQMKHPTTSQWYVTKTSQWYVSTTSH